MCRAVEDTALIGPYQTSAASPVDGDGNGIRQVAIAARDTAKDAVGADTANVHDLVRGTRLTEAGRGRGAVGGLAEYRRPGRESGIRRAEVRGAEPDEIDPARRSGRDPREEVSAFIVVDLYRPCPRISSVAGTREPDVVDARRNQVVGKNRVDVARDTSQLGIINGKSGEDPVGVCLPSPADISIED